MAVTPVVYAGFYRGQATWKAVGGDAKGARRRKSVGEFQLGGAEGDNKEQTT